MRTYCLLKCGKQAEGVLFGIIEEAVGNAKKYARASKIEISLTVGEEALLVEVRDDGIGFDVDEILPSIDQGGGLILNMMKRAEFVGGHCNTVSGLNEGTTVSVQIPFPAQGD